MPQRDLEKRRAYEAAYRARNREQLRARAKAWREANPELKAAQNKRYREANPEKVKAAHQAWLAKNPEKVAAKIKRDTAAKRKRRKDDPEYAMRQAEYWRAKHAAKKGLKGYRRPMPSWLVGTVPDVRIAGTTVHIAEVE